MAAPTKEERLAAVHARAIQEFNKIQLAQRDERIQCLKDRRFYSIAGAQWEGDLEAQFANKPRFEVNKIHLAVIRIINEYRNNRISVDFLPKDGSHNDITADACDGMYRADEQDSCAQEAYDNAFEEAVGGGFGAFRLCSEYEDDSDKEDERQRIKIEPIYDADSCVFFDGNAKRQDKSDARRAWVLCAMTPDSYREEWGEEPDTIPHQITQEEFDWNPQDKVYIAEYYEIEEKKRQHVVMRAPSLDPEAEPEEQIIPDDELDDEKLAELKALGFQEVRRKKVCEKKVRKYIIDGARVLEDCGYIAGTCIPIIPVYGKRWFVDNIERCMGHVRLSMDAQRLKNMMISMLAEIATLSKTEKPIVTPQQIAGHQETWANDNVQNYPYLLLNPITDANGQEQAAGPIAYTKSPQIPPALAALMQQTEQDLQDLLGNQQAGEQLQPNMSGKAVELIQNRLDMQVFIYMSNFAKAIKRAGEVWLSMAADVYSEPGRRMKTVSSDSSVGSVELMKPMVSPDGRQYMANDMTEARFDVVADVGPSAISQRAATVRGVTGMMTITQDPETLMVLSNIALMNMEGEGIGDVRAWSRRKLVQAGVIKPTPEEQQEMQAAMAAAAQKQDPQAQLLVAAANQANADAQRSQADTVNKLANARKLEADTIKTISETNLNDQQRVLTAMQSVQQATSLPDSPSDLVSQ